MARPYHEVARVMTVFVSGESKSLADDLYNSQSRGLKVYV